MFRHFYFVLLLILFIFDLIPIKGFAAPKTLTYQGRIVKVDGTPLEYNNVSFVFQITDPSGLCVLYQEQVDGLNMTNSNGVFDTPIGKGTRSYPASGVFTVIDALNNSSTLNCQGSSTYTPVSDDGRLLRAQFYDGTGWKIISPDNVIRSVPYAGFATSALKLGNNVASDFVLKTGIPTCTAGTFLSWDGTILSCAAVTGSNGGTVTNVSSANSYLTVSNNTSTPSLLVNVGTTAGTLAAGNDSRLFDSRIPTGTAAGDLSGTYPNPTVAKLQSISVSATAPTTGQFLKYNGTNWQGTAIAISDVSGLSTSLSSTLLQSQFPGSCTTNQTLTFISPSGTFSCSNIAINGTQVSGNIAGNSVGFTGSLAGDVSGTQAATTVDKIKGVPLTMAGNATGKVLTFDGTNWAPASIPAGNSGTVTSVSSSNSYITVTSATSTPAITLNVGSVANSVAAGNDSRLVNAIQNAGATVSLQSGLDASKGSASTAGRVYIATDTFKIYRDNGTSWDTIASNSGSGISALTSDVSASGTGSVAATVNSVGGSSAANIHTAELLANAATNTNTANTIVKRDASGNIAAGTMTGNVVGNLTGSTSLNVLKAGDTMTGNLNFASTKGTVFTDSTSNTVSIVAPTTVTSNYSLKLPTAVAGIAGQVLTSDTSGNLSWTTPSTTATSYSGVLPIANGGTNNSTALSNNRIMVSSGNTITEAAAMTNGQLLIGSSGAAPVAASLTAGSGITITPGAGSISIATNGLGSTSLADGKIWVGQTTTPTAVSPAGDVTMSNAGSFTVSKLQGTAVSATTPTFSGQVLRYNGTTWTPNFVSMADLRSTITGASALSSCTSGQTLTWSAATDNLACSNIAVTAANFSSQTANTFLAAPNGSAGTPTFRSLASADLPSGVVTTGTYKSVTVDTYGRVTAGTNPTTTSGYGITDAVINGGQTGAVTLGPSDANSLTMNTSGTAKMTILSGGNVGVGTTNPGLSTTAGRTYLTVLGPSNSGVIELASGASDADGASNGLVQFTDSNSSQADRRLATIHVLKSGSTVGNRGAALTFGVRDDNSSGANERMRISGAGNVGIGTTNPPLKLSVNGEIQVGSTSAVCNATNAGALQFSGSTMLLCNGTSWTSVGGSSTQGPSFFAHKNGTNQSVSSGTTLLTWSTEAFDTNNNFSSNTFTPTVAGKYIVTLTVNCTTGSDCAANIRKNGSAISGGYMATNTNAQPVATVIVDMNGTTDYLDSTIYTGSGSTIGGAIYASNFSASLLTSTTVASGGSGTTNYVPYFTSSTALGNSPVAISGTNVGIGTTNPTQKLEVAGSAILNQSGSNLALFINNGAGSNTVKLDSNGNSWFTGGNVGIGTTNPSYSLDVWGSTMRLGVGGYGSSTILLYGSKIYDTGSSLHLYGGGNSVISDHTFFTPTGGVSSSSDRRLKTNIFKLGNGLEKIMELKPVSYDWRNPDLHGKIKTTSGFIAQDLQKIFPSMVNQTKCQGKDCELVDKSGDHLSVNFGPHFFAHLVSSIQEIYTQLKQSILNQTEMSQELASMNEQKADKIEIENLKKELFIKEQKIKELEHKNEEMNTRLEKIEKIIEKNNP